MKSNAASDGIICVSRMFLVRENPGLELPDVPVPTIDFAMEMRWLQG